MTLNYIGLNDLITHTFELAYAELVEPEVVSTVNVTIITSPY